MPDRRTFLAATAALPLLAAAPEGAVVLACLDPVPGAVTAQSGSVNGVTPTFVDACTTERQQVLPSSWQQGTVLSDKAANPPAYGGVGARHRANQLVKGELRLILGLNAARLDGQPVPELPPGTYPALVNFEEPAGSGNSYRFTPTWQKLSIKNCNASEQTATGGTVTVAVCDPGAPGLEGSYALQFGADQLAGTLVAPRVDYTDCPPRPGTSTCLNA